ncbi:MAG: Asp-tRNA(Asn)/Glu-tRNA(Gln) amidotransferase subunit GatB [Cytophagales bacterium]|nr:Asp-tRNA(Asn)/Glu-tRNA(Gln) amidotransferase subunit GatB [Cytophagales bacterium]
MSDQAYQVVVGLEIHVQLKTNSKIFSADPASFGELPNENIGVVTLAHPGTLPKLNRKVIEFAVKMGLACHSDISQNLLFDRKNYFYPDLPKGYQLTQDRLPICRSGFISARLQGNETRQVKLIKIHLEEDAGKSMHNIGSFTAVDFNRAGMPLIEIVTQPDIYAEEEAVSVLSEVRRMIRFLGISDGDMEKGSMRCDVNISVRPAKSDVLGKKVEIKNMNSMRNVAHAITHEKARQIKLLEAGAAIVSETRNFNADTGTTASMRMKEELNDYRYFPEPDLSSAEITDEELAGWKSEMPDLPQDLFDQFTTTYHLPAYNAEVLIEEPGLAAYAYNLFKATDFKKQASNWLMGPVKSWLNEHKTTIDQFPITVDQWCEMLELLQTKQLGHTSAAQKLFPFLLENPRMGVLDACNTLNLLLEQNDSELQPVIDEILAAHPDKVKAYQNGKKGLIGMFMGELVKKTKGRVDAQVASKMLEESLKP